MPRSPESPPQRSAHDSTDGAAIGDITYSFTIVPETATGFLFASGLAALAVTRKAGITKWGIEQRVHTCLTPDV